jgi:hypothetical protein
MGFQVSDKGGIDTPEFRHNVEYLVGTGLAANSLNNIASGKKLTTPASRAAHTAGTFAIGWGIAHYIMFPYMAITGAIFSIPFWLYAYFGTRPYWVGHPIPGRLGWERGHYVHPLLNDTACFIILAICFLLWVYFAMWKWYIKKFLLPVDRYLTAPLRNDPVGTTAVENYPSVRVTQEAPTPRPQASLNPYYRGPLPPGR